MAESGVAAVAHTDNWDVMLGDDLEVQVQTRAVTFQFKLLSFEILKEIKEFCQKKCQCVTHVGRFGKTNLHLFWDEEYPDKTRAFLKAYPFMPEMRDVEAEHLLEFTFEGESLVDLESCVDQLLEDLAG
jgi:hypothetical protein